MKQAAYDLCYLAACAVNGFPAEPERIQAMKLENVFRVSRSHSLSALVSMTLSAAGMDVTPEWQAEKAKAIRKAILFERERTDILRFMEENGIWYLPMKGVILQDLYPKPGMREMADNDILYDKTRQSDVTAFMRQKGYTAKSVGKYHHDIFYKEPIYNFKLHTEMFPENTDKRFTAYYGNVTERLLSDGDGKFGRHMRDEDFYIHMTAHEYKHYSNSGTGLRSLLDRYVYVHRKGESLDWEYITAECAVLGIDAFEEASRALCRKVFGTPVLPELTETEREMLEAYMFSTTYGTVSMRIQHRLEKDYGKIDRKTKTKYFLRRIFPDTEFYREYAPVAYRHKILIPAVWFGRLLKAVFKKRKVIRNEVDILRKMQ